MDRRNFLKGAAVASAAGVVMPFLVNAQTAWAQTSVIDTTHLEMPKHRRFTLTQTYDLKVPQGSSGDIKLWIPLIEDTPFQQLRQLRFSGNYDIAYSTSDNQYSAKTLFARWPEAREPVTMVVEMVIDTQDWEITKHGDLANYTPPSDLIYPLDVQAFLQPTAHMPIDGIVRETMQQAVGNEINPLKKARLIYDWVTANMFRDNAVMGCGVGDVNATLTSGRLGGKCTDISSVFVALMRSAGIPAREMFGIRLGRPGVLAPYSASAFGSSDEKGLANVSGAQHCRAQFYLAGFGWVPCDPADVTKMRLSEKKEHSDPAVQAVNDYLFGNWDMNWVGFNYGRDFDLVPAAEQTPINNFGYPYAEVNGDPLNYYAPSSFAYDYVSQEQLG